MTMPIQRRALRSLLVTLLLFGAAAPAFADRPSLIGLQATVDQVVNGLCNGDAATCGTTPVTPAVGTLIFDAAKLALPLGLVDLSMSASRGIDCSSSPCIPTSGASASPVFVTVLQDSSIAKVGTVIMHSAAISQVEVELPGEGVVLHFENTYFTSMVPADDAGRVKLQFVYGLVHFEWKGGIVEWNAPAQQVNGCGVDPSQAHVDLAGNATGNLAPDEVEATFGMQLTASPPSFYPLVSFRRQPPDPCYLFVIAKTPPEYFEAKLERLWTANDAFPSERQAVETIELQTAFAQSWQLSIASGALSEKIGLVVQTGRDTHRTFDPNTGQELTSEFIDF